MQFVPQVEPAPISSWSPSPRSTDSSPAPVSVKRPRENGQEPETEMEPAPKKAFGFEMKLSSNLVRKKRSVLTNKYYLQIPMMTFN